MSAECFLDKVYKIKEDYRAYSASEEQMPNFRSDAHNFFIVLPNLNYGRKDVVYINGGNMVNATVNATVNELDATLIKILKENPSVNYAFLAKETGKDRATIARHLKSMSDAGKIRRIGSAKTGYWEIIEQHQIPL